MPPSVSPLREGGEKPSPPRSRRYFFRYLSERGVANLPNYKYSGSDASFIYQKFLSPMLNNWVETGKVPTWLHPNVITLIGLLCMVVSHVVTTLYCPTFTESAPWWVWTLNATAQLIYWVLDALDGKQARRTGTSSPLGLLVDHGCDAINTTIGMLNTAAMIKTGPTISLLILWTAPAAVFFAATWEEYYVGSLDLPIINGPNEGVILGIFFQLLTAFYGNELWDQTVYGYTCRSGLMMLLGVMSIPTMALNIWNVEMAVKHMKRDENQSKYTTSQLEAGTSPVALSRVVPMIAMLGTAGVWAYFSPTDILSRHPRIYMWTLGLLLCKLVMTMMVSHLSNDSYHPFGKTLAGFLALSLHGFLTYQYTGTSSPAWEDLVLHELAAVVVVSYLHMVFSLVWEISTLLDIPVFTVPKEKQERLKAQ
eukprot:TRINITY_DN448_c0_g1_i2.p1 TRINITY_DN448_c0_g1~~TRINITY_DN448_c0_g1_i2.p1  ORF type:complete len:423 (+),score=64.07 TRINITY_DN448_c0_g1_i2:249-1517(+)